jgi:biotin carboxyl carrier protein
MTTVLAEMSARVWQLPVPDGTRVEAGEVIAVLESMKMEIPVLAPVAGSLSLRVTEGAEVAEGDPIAEVR